MTWLLCISAVFTVSKMTPNFSCGENLSSLDEPFVATLFCFLPCCAALGNRLSSFLRIFYLRWPISQTQVNWNTILAECFEIRVKSSTCEISKGTSNCNLEPATRAGVAERELLALGSVHGELVLKLLARCQLCILCILWSSNYLFCAYLTNFNLQVNFSEHTLHTLIFKLFVQCTLCKLWSSGYLFSAYLAYFDPQVICLLQTLHT